MELVFRVESKDKHDCQICFMLKDGLIIKVLNDESDDYLELNIDKNDWILLKNFIDASFTNHEIKGEFNKKELDDLAIKEEKK